MKTPKLKIERYQNGFMVSAEINGKIRAQIFSGFTRAEAKRAFLNSITEEESND